MTSTSTYIIENPFSDSMEIREVDAFFLGALLVSNEPMGDSGKKWKAYFRHNPGMVPQAQIDEHRNAISKLAHMVGAKVHDLDDRFDGFEVELSLSRPWSVGELVTLAEEIAAHEKDSFVAAFLSGSFDGKSSFDRAMGSSGEMSAAFVLDYPENHDSIADAIESNATRLGIAVNINKNRQRKEGGNDRKPQIRISAKRSELFFTKVGLVSPYRMMRAQRQHSKYSYFVEKYPSALPGVKTLSGRPQRNHSAIKPISDLSLINYESSRDFFQERACTTERLEAKAKVENSGPKERGKLNESSSSGKVGSYERNKEVAKNALSNASFKCEIDPSHRTFVREADGTPFVLPHHLVPMSYQKDFTYSIDIEENIVALCSCCHDEIHHGRDRERLLSTLYKERQEGLFRVGIDVSFDELKTMYDL